MRMTCGHSELNLCDLTDKMSLSADLCFELQRGKWSPAERRKKWRLFSAQWQNLVCAAHFIARDVWASFFFFPRSRSNCFSGIYLQPASSWWNDVPHVVLRKPAGFISHLHHSTKCLDSARLSSNTYSCAGLSHSISNFQRWWRSAAAGQRLTFATCWRWDKLSAASSTESRRLCFPPLCFVTSCVPMVTESSALQGRNEETSQILVSPLFKKKKAICMDYSASWMSVCLSLGIYSEKEVC